MQLIFQITLCFLPLIILIVMCKFMAGIKISHQLIACLFGLIAILPISVIQFFMDGLKIFSNNSLGFVLLKSIVLYGLIEESLKLVLILPLPRKNYTAKNFLFLSFVFGLSLGCFESVVYFLDHLQKSNAIGGSLLYGQIFLRMFTSDFIHTFCTGLLGLFIFEKRKGNRHIFLIIISILLHGLYDFFAGFQNNFWYFSIVVILFSAIECRLKYTLYNYEKKDYNE